MVLLRPFLAGLVAVLAVVAAQPAAASPGRAPCWSGYSYVGVQSATPAFGVSAVLSVTAVPAVGSGHVAAWIGVGGAGLGPGGSDEWLQAGIVYESNGVAHLYYELKRPGDAHATYVQLGVVVPGEPHSLALFERSGLRDSWSVTIDGVRTGAPVVLPGSHGTFAPIATTESWDGGVAGNCNRYGFDFSRLALESGYGSGWRAFDLARVLHDPGYRLALRPSGFTAASR